MKRLVLILALTAATALPTAQPLAHDDHEPNKGAFTYSTGEAASLFHRLTDGPWLGVGVEEETDLAEGGARVTYVVDFSPADRAGIRRGDIIISVGGDAVRGPAGLSLRLDEHEEGDTLDLEIVRDGKRERLEAKITKPERSFAVSPRQYGTVYSLFSSGRPKLGVQLVEVTAELREHLGGRGSGGVLVSKVIAGTPAEEGGIEVGDLIVAVDGETVETAGDLQRAVAHLEGKDVDVEVVRDGRATTLRISFPESDSGRPSGPRASVIRGAVPRPAAVAVAPQAPRAPAAVVAPAPPRPLTVRTIREF